MWWALIAALVVGGSIYAYIEYHAYLLRTEVTTLPTGLRFTAQGFSVESRNSSKDIVVQTRDGHYTHKAAADAEPTVQTGGMTVTLSAVGTQFEVARLMIKPDAGLATQETGFSNLTFSASDTLRCQAERRTPGEQSVLRIEHVPNAIAADFQLFVARLQLWIAKMERTILIDLDARRKAEEETARAEAKAAAAAKKGMSSTTTNGPLTDAEREARAAEQIASWRKVAGFKGSSTEVSIGPAGEVVWFIDLDPGGRVILHAANRTFHGSLKGAHVTVLAGELEIGVRDDFWTEYDPQLVTFRVLSGVAPEARLAWKERLDILIRSLR